MRARTVWTAVLAATLFATAAGCGVEPGPHTASRYTSHPAATHQPTPSVGATSTASAPSQPAGVRMLSTSDGWAWGWRDGSLAVWRTSNGGTTWEETTAPPVMVDPSLASEATVADFPTPSTGVIATLAVEAKGPALQVFRTVDGGKTWTKVHDGLLAAGGTLLSLQMVTPADGFLLASAGFAMQREQKTVLRTTDGGSTWQVVSSDTGYVEWPGATPSALPEEGGVQATFGPDGTGFAGTTVELESPSFIGLYRSTDSGATWQQVDVALPTAIAANDYTVTEAPVMAGKRGTLLVICRGRLVETLSYTTNDGGATWTLGATIPAGLLTAGFSSPDSGLLFSPDGKAWSTSDGGRNWTQVPLSTNLSTSIAAGDVVLSVDAVTPTDAWMILTKLSPESAVDNVATLLVTHDGGKTWRTQSLGQ